mgnify:CR=1 FL=1
MPDYVFKTYLADGREHFLYGEMGDSRAQLTKKDFPFPESLLRLLYLDIWAYGGQIKQFDKLLMELYRTREEKCARQLLPLLDGLAESHIYFQLLRLDWRARLREARRRNYENILDLLPHKEITHIPSNIHTIQEQVLGLIQKVLDMDGRKGSLEKKLEDYYAQGEREPLMVFRFHPQLMDFARVKDHGFVEILYPGSIYDLIDFSVRECVKREVKMRVCKNCGHWFAITGRTNAEYCEVTRDSKGRTCKEIGAIALWNKNKSEDEVFKIYRREYKKRFAWIKAGRITDEQFYAWSEQAREMKKKCDREVITLDEFQDWLAKS